MRPALLAAVAAGSLIGGTLRGSLALLQPVDAWLPWVTLFANSSGSLLIGLYAGLNTAGGRLRHGETMQQFVASGICGGFTTFSIFSLETLMLLHADRIAAAIANVVLSIVLCMLAVTAGFTSARRARPGSARMG